MATVPVRYGYDNASAQSGPKGKHYANARHKFYQSHIASCEKRCYSLNGSNEDLLTVRTFRLVKARAKVIPWSMSDQPPVNWMGEHEKLAVAERSTGIAGDDKKFEDGSVGTRLSARQHDEVLRVAGRSKGRASRRSGRLDLRRLPCWQLGAGREYRRGC